MRSSTRLAACTAGLIGLAFVAGACNPNDRTAHYSVSETTVGQQPAFSVPVLNVIAFQKVEIDLTNTTDATRGFAIDGYGIDKQLQPGDHVLVRFKANMSGTFRIHDSVDQRAPDARLVVASA